MKVTALNIDYHSNWMHCNWNQEPKWILASWAKQKPHLPHVRCRTMYIQVDDLNFIFLPVKQNSSNRICCRSILSLVHFLFSFVLYSLSYIYIKIEPRIKLNYNIYTIADFNKWLWVCPGLSSNFESPAALTFTCLTNLVFCKSKNTHKRPSSPLTSRSYQAYPAITGVTGHSP